MTNIITKQSKFTRNFKAAIAYSKLLNWPVFPLWPKSKKPIHTGGFHIATTDLKQITTWWGEQPNANIGIPTGRVSGFFVLDIDPRNKGNESLEHLIKLHGKLPDTVEAKTGGEGKHILFKYQEGIKKGVLLNGIDVQSDGAYIVVSPSLHPNGNNYSWQFTSKLKNKEIANAPRWLLKMLLHRAPSKTKNYIDQPERFIKILSGTKEGERNNNMMALIGHLLSKQIDYRIAYELVLLWNSRNKPPLSYDEVTRAFNNILKKEVAKRGGGDIHGIRS